MKKRFKILIILLVFFSVCMAGCVTGTASQSPTNYKQPLHVSDENTNPKTNSPVQTFKVGDSASNGKQTVTVNAVKYIQFNSINDWSDYLNKQLPNGQVVMIDITVNNLQTDKTQNADWGSIVSDDSGYTYKTGGYGMIYSPYTQNNPEIDKINILPGEKRRGNEGFLVPIDAKGLKYQYNFGDGYTAVFNLN